MTVDSEMLDAFAVLLEDAADLLDTGPLTWGRKAFCVYHGMKPISYAGESPTGQYAPGGAITLQETRGERCQVCVMGACVAACVVGQLHFPTPEDAGLFLGELEQFLNLRVPRSWNGIFGWNDQKPDLDSHQVIAFLRGQAAYCREEAHR